VRKGVKIPGNPGMKTLTANSNVASEGHKGKKGLTQKEGEPRQKSKKGEGK